MDELHEHVERFNAGIRAGDFSRMLEGFAEDAELEFVGVPVGPFHGRAAIAGYAWTAEPETRAGELRLTVRNALIHRMVVTFD